MARFGITAKDHAKLHKLNGMYARLFRMHQSTETPNARVAAGRVGKGRRGARKAAVDSQRDRACCRVVAGEERFVTLKNQREESSKVSYVARNSSAAFKSIRSWNETIAALNTEREKELEYAIRVLKEWYMRLVHTSGPP